MTQQKCGDCLFAVVVEDEFYMSCEAKQMLVMAVDKACDYYEERGCVCKECTTMELNDKYANVTSKACDCDECCNTNSYPLGEDSTELDFLLDDFVTASDEVGDTLAFLGEGTTVRDVLGAILGLEATIAILKRHLLDWEEKV
jgi:hypothetical protein